jgi:hypothetical protein
MNKSEAIKAANNGALAATISFAISAVIFAYAYSTNQTSGFLRLFNDPLVIFDLLIVSVCAFGMTHKSRAAAVVVLVHFILSKIAMIQDTGKFNGAMVAVILLYYYAKAIQGTFVYHKIEKQNNPEYKYAPKWSFYIGIPLGIIFCFLTLLGLVVGDPGSL